MKFLLNKSEASRGLLFHLGVRELVGHVPGPVYLFSWCHAHLHPSGTEPARPGSWSG